MKNKNRKRLLCTTLTAILVLSAFVVGIMPVSAQGASVTRELPYPSIVKTNEEFVVTLKNQSGFSLVGVVNETLPVGFAYVVGSFTGSGTATYNPSTRNLSLPFEFESSVSYRVKASSYDQISAKFSGVYGVFVIGPNKPDGPNKPVGGDSGVAVESGAPPYTTGHNPAKGATGVPVDTNIVVQVRDNGSGVNHTTIKMTVNGVPVTPVILPIGLTLNFSVTYDPPVNLSYGKVVNVTINASDRAGNAMPTDKYSFTTEMGVEDTEPPIVTNPNADPSIIPEDTDNEPLWGELANLSVVVTDASEIASVTINLSSIGGSAVQQMTEIGDSNVWNVSTNASIDSAIFDGGAYQVHQLEVNATDEHGNPNTSVSIELTVMKNGDVDASGGVNLDDAIYLANYALLVPGYDVIPEIADVDGNEGPPNLDDGIYLANYALLVPGYGILH